MGKTVFANYYLTGGSIILFKDHTAPFTLDS